jgi:hypothetical protein
LVRGKIYFAVKLTFEDPNLHTDLSIDRECLGQSVVNICTQCLKRNATFLVLLGAGHLSTTQTSGTHDFATFSTHTHGRGKGGFHGTAERDTCLKLLCYLLTHQTRIQFWALDFEDVDLNILLGNLFDFFLEAIHFLTTTANHNTWTAGVDGNGDALQGALDDNLGNTTTCDTCFEVFADTLVFDKLVSVIVAAVPVGIPTFGNPETESDRMCFLSHLDYA